MRRVRRTAGLTPALEHRPVRHSKHYPNSAPALGVARNLDPDRVLHLVAAALEELALLKHVQGLRILMSRMDKYSRWIRETEVYTRKTNTHHHPAANQAAAARTSAAAAGPGPGTAAVDAAAAGRSDDPKKRAVAAQTRA